MHMMKPSVLVDTRVIYCGDNVDQLAKLPDACVDLIYIDPPFNSNRNYEVFWGEAKETRAFEDRHASTEAYIAYMRPRCEELHRVLQSKPGKVPAYKRYLDEGKGVPLGTVWDDIGPVQGQSGESLGYPTQKPLALLNRILEISSRENDIVLDAFCGCGTALAAAQNMKRQWIGIDVSPTACRVMAKRLRDDCKLPEDETLWKTGRGFVVRDLPWTEDKLRKIPPFEFENWAVIALGGIPNKTKAGDMGIDGRIFPAGAVPRQMSKATGHLDFMDAWYPVQVKQKDKVGRPDIDSFEAMMTRADRAKGFFVSFDYSRDALTEVDAFFRKSRRVIVPLTVREILNEQLAIKLA